VCVVAVVRYNDGDGYGLYCKHVQDVYPD